MKPTVRKMLAYARLRTGPEEKKQDSQSRQNTVEFYRELRRRGSSLLCRRAFLAASDHNDRIGYMFITGKFYPGDFIGEGRLYGWENFRAKNDE